MQAFLLEQKEVLTAVYHFKFGPNLQFSRNSDAGGVTRPASGIPGGPPGGLQAQTVYNLAALVPDFARDVSTSYLDS